MKRLITANKNGALLWSRGLYLCTQYRHGFFFNIPASATINSIRQIGSLGVWVWEKEKEINAGQMCQIFKIKCSTSGLKSCQMDSSQSCSIFVTCPMEISKRGKLLHCFTIWSSVVDTCDSNTRHLWRGQGLKLQCLVFSLSSPAYLGSDLNEKPSCTQPCSSCWAQSQTPA